MIPLSSGEKIIFVARKHWFVLFLSGFSLALCAILPFLFFAVVDFSSISLNIEMKDGSSPAAFGFFLYTIWLLFLWIGFFIHWTDFYLDAWYITNQRIIAVDQKGFFNREVSSIHLDRVQDVTTETVGLIPTLLNFGDLKVQTAGQDSSNFILTAARAPRQAKDIIVQEHNKVSHLTHRI